MPELTSFDYPDIVRGYLASEDFNSVPDERKPLAIESFRKTFVDENGIKEDEDLKYINDKSAEIFGAYRHNVNIPRFTPTPEQSADLYGKINVNEKDPVEKRVQSIEEWRDAAIPKASQKAPSIAEDFSYHVEDLANNLIKSELAKDSYKPGGMPDFLTDSAKRFTEQAIKGLGVDLLADYKEANRFFAKNLVENPEFDNDFSSQVVGGLGNVLSQVALSAGMTAAGAPELIAPTLLTMSTARHMTEAYNRELKRTGNELIATDAAVNSIPAGILDAGPEIFLGGLLNKAKGFSGAYKAATTEAAKKAVIKEYIPLASKEFIKQGLNEGLLGGVGTDVAGNLGDYYATGDEQYLKNATNIGELARSFAVEGTVGAMVGAGIAGLTKGSNQSNVSATIAQLTDAGTTAGLADTKAKEVKIFEAIKSGNYDKAIEISKSSIVAPDKIIKGASQGNTKPPLDPSGTPIKDAAEATLKDRLGADLIEQSKIKIANKPYTDAIDKTIKTLDPEKDKVRLEQLTKTRSLFENETGPVAFQEETEFESNDNSFVFKPKKDYAKQTKKPFDVTLQDDTNLKNDNVVYVKQEGMALVKNANLIKALGKPVTLQTSPNGRLVKFKGQSKQYEASPNPQTGWVPVIVSGNKIKILAPVREATEIAKQEPAEAIDPAEVKSKPSLVDDSEVTQTETIDQTRVDEATEKLNKNTPEGKKAVAPRVKKTTTRTKKKTEAPVETVVEETTEEVVQEAEVETNASEKPSSVLPVRATENVSPRPNRKGRDTTERDSWDENYGEMRKGGKTHNDDGTPYQPTVLDETIPVVFNSLKDKTFDERIDAIGSDIGAELSTTLKRLLDDGWIWDSKENRMVNPLNKNENPLQGLRRLKKIREGSVSTVEPTVEPEPVIPTLETIDQINETENPNEVISSIDKSLEFQNEILNDPDASESRKAQANKNITRLTEEKARIQPTVKTEQPAKPIDRGVLKQIVSFAEKGDLTLAKFDNWMSRGFISESNFPQLSEIYGVPEYDGDLGKFAQSIQAAIKKGKVKQPNQTVEQAIEETITPIQNTVQEEPDIQSILQQEIEQFREDTQVILQQQRENTPENIARRKEQTDRINELAKDVGLKNLRIVNTHEELNRADVDDAVQGFVEGGQVVMILDNIIPYEGESQIEATERIFKHEVVGHLKLSGVLSGISPEGFNNLVKFLKTLKWRSGDNVWERTKAAYTTETVPDDLEIVDEIFAKLTENKDKESVSLINKIINWVRIKFLKAGIANWTPNDLDIIIQTAFNSELISESDANIVNEDTITDSVSVVNEINNNIEEVLTTEEKSQAATELGFKKWNEEVLSEFKNQISDWLVYGKAKTKTLEEIFVKLLKSLKNVSAAILAAISINTGDASVTEIGFNQLRQSPVFNIESTIPNVNITSEFLGNIDPQIIPVKENTQNVSLKESSPIKITANFNGAKAHRSVVNTANEIINKKNNEGKPFIIGDKSGGLLYVFDENGNLKNKAPALFGADKGDNIVDDKKITPSGRFKASVENADPADYPYGKTLDFLEKEDGVVAIHRVYLAKPEENRQDRLNSGSPLDNRVSSGCVNVNDSVMDEVINPTFEKEGGFVYILPENRNENIRFSKSYQNTYLDSNIRGYGAWIAPNGKIIDVGYQAHFDKAADIIGEEALDGMTVDGVYNEMAKRGYVRVVNGSSILVDDTYNLTPTHKKVLEFAGINGDKNVIIGDKYLYKTPAMATRFSRSQTNINDQKYLASVESGDMETAQKMVDLAAKEAGYDIKAYHGTSDEFTEFDPDRYLTDRDQLSGPGINTTNSESEASDYGNKILNVVLKLKNPAVMRLNIYERFTPKERELINSAVEKDEELVARRLINGYIEPYAGDYIQIKTENRGDVSIFDKNVLNELGLKIGRINKNDAKIIASRIKDGIITPYSHKYKVEGKDVGSFRASQQKIIEILKSKGFDGVEYLVPESDTWHKTGSIHRVVFDPNQIKSADPVTKDDQGNVIPLSQRFSNSPDIRFSKSQPKQKAPVEPTEDNDLDWIVTDNEIITQSKSKASKEIAKLIKRTHEQKLIIKEIQINNAFKNVNYAFLNDSDVESFLNDYRDFVNTRNKQEDPATERIPVDELERRLIDYKKKANKNEYEFYAGRVNGFPEFAFFNEDAGAARAYFKELTEEKNDDTASVVINDSDIATMDAVVDLQFQAIEAIDDISDVINRGVVDMESSLVETGNPILDAGIPILREQVAIMRKLFNEYALSLITTDATSLSGGDLRRVYYSLLSLVTDGYPNRLEGFISSETTQILRDMEATFRDPYGTKKKNSDISKLESNSSQIERLATDGYSYDLLTRLQAPFREGLVLAKRYHEEIITPYIESLQKDIYNGVLDADTANKIGMFGILRQRFLVETPEQALKQSVQWVLDSNKNTIGVYDKDFDAQGKRHQEYLEENFLSGINYTIEKGQITSDFTPEDVAKFYQNANIFIGDKGIQYADGIVKMYDALKPLSRFTTEFIYGRPFEEIENYIPTMSVIIKGEGDTDFDLAKPQLLTDAKSFSSGQIFYGTNTSGLGSTKSRTRKVGTNRSLVFNINYTGESLGRIAVYDYFTAHARQEMSQLLNHKNKNGKLFAKFLGDPEQKRGRTDAFRSAMNGTWQNVMSQASYMHSYHVATNWLGRKFAQAVLSGAHQLPAQLVSNTTPYFVQHINEPRKIGNYFKAAAYILKHRSGLLEPHQSRVVDKIIFEVTHRQQFQEIDKSVNLDINPKSITEMIKKEMPYLYKAIVGVDKGIENVLFKAFRLSDTLSGAPMMLAEYLNSEQDSKGSHVRIEDLTYDSVSYIKAIDATERYIGIGDASRRGEFLTNKNAAVSIGRNLLVAFRSFSINNAVNFGKELRRLFDSNISREQKAQSFKYMMGIAAQSVTYTMMAYAVQYGMASAIAHALKNPEEEEELKKLYSKSQNRMTKNERRMLNAEISMREKNRKVVNNIQNRTNDTRILAIKTAKDALSNMFIPFNLEFVPNIIIHVGSDGPEADVFKAWKSGEVERIQKLIKRNKALENRKTVTLLNEELANVQMQEFLPAVYEQRTIANIGGSFGGTVEGIIDAIDSGSKFFMKPEAISPLDFVNLAAAIGVSQPDIKRFFRASSLVEKSTKERDEQLAEYEQN